MNWSINEYPIPTLNWLHVTPNDLETATDVLENQKEQPSQWEFQDPKMEVLYHIRPYFMGMFPYIGLT